MKIAYLIARFPVPSETFVAAEAARLMALGIELEIYSFAKPSPEDARHLDATSRKLLASTSYVGGWELLLAALGNPAALLSALRENRRLQKAATLKANALIKLLRAVAIRQRMKRAGIRHLHAHWPYATQVAHLVQSMSTISFSVSIHAHEVAHDNGHFPLVFDTLSFATFCNRGAMEYLLQQLPAAARRNAYLVYHGVDLHGFAQLPLPSASRPIAVLSAGRMTKTKGFDHLIRACAQARAQGVDVRLTILGRGSTEAALRALAAEIGFTPFLSMPGWVSHEEIKKHMAGTHLFALLADTTFHDGLPNVVLEAMASGRPVVLSPLPAAAEAVTEGVEGFILKDANDIPGLVGVLERLAQEPELFHAMGARARQRVESDHDANKQITRLVDLFMQHRAVTATVSEAASGRPSPL